MNEYCSQNDCSFIPRTYNLPVDKKAYKKIPQGKYIVKPNLYQSKGVFVFAQLPSYEEFVEKTKDLVNPVMSELIEDLTLCEGKKFEIRSFLVMTSVYPMKLYANDMSIVTIQIGRAHV